MSWITNIPEYAVLFAGPIGLGSEVGKRLKVVERWNDLDVGEMEFAGFLGLAALSVFGGTILTGVVAYEFTKLFPGGGDGGLAILSVITYLASFAVGSRPKGEV